MRLLLDTHALLWWLQDDPKLGPRARQRLSDPGNHVLASVVSLWEITIKWRVGKMNIQGSSLALRLAEQGVNLISVEAEHIAAVEKLPFHHGDPFDHLLLAQAVVEDATMLTSDRQMAAYGVPCIGVT